MSSIANPWGGAAEGAVAGRREGMGEPGLGYEAAGDAQDAAGFGVADREGHASLYR
jgi:hypothetical protein